MNSLEGREGGVDLDPVRSMGTSRALLGAVSGGEYFCRCVMRSLQGGGKGPRGFVDGCRVSGVVALFVCS